MSHAPLQLRRDHLLTLNDFQKLLGDINWIRPHLKLTTADLKPLFDCLKGDPNPSSKRELTSEAKLALVKVDEVLNDQLIRIHITRGWDLIILATEHTPTGCLWQEGPLEWLHLPVTPGHEFEQTPGDDEGQRILVCCSPRGCKELDMTE